MVKDPLTRKQVKAAFVPEDEDGVWDGEVYGAEEIEDSMCLEDESIAVGPTHLADVAETAAKNVVGKVASALQSFKGKTWKQLNSKGDGDDPKNETKEDGAASVDAKSTLLADEEVDDSQKFELRA